MKSIWLASMIFGEIVLATGCAKMPVVHSMWRDDNSTNSVQYYEDSKNQIKWTVLNDQDNLYVQIKTTNPKIAQMVLRDGLTLYVDTLSGKHKGCSLLVRNKPEGLMERIMPRGRRPDMKSLATRSFDEAYWEKGGEKIFMDLKYEKTEYLASYGNDMSDGFSCLLIFPANFFNYKKQLHEHLPISLGLSLKSEEFKLPSMSKVNPEGNGNTGMRGTPGGMGGGMGGGRRGGGGMPQFGGSSESNSLETWVQVFLTNK